MGSKKNSCRGNYMSKYGICYLRGGFVYSRGYVYCFCQKFQGFCLFRGVRLFWTLEYVKKISFSSFEISRSIHRELETDGGKGEFAGARFEWVISLNRQCICTHRLVCILGDSGDCHITH